MKIGRVVETAKPNLKLVNSNRELAQLVERHPYKVDVAGSNPVLPTKSYNLQISDVQIVKITP